MKLKGALEDIGYRSAYGFAYALSLAPMSLLYGIATLAFILAYYIPGYRKAVVVQNVARSFPDMRYGEVIGIVRKFYSCFTGYLAEIVKSIILDSRRQIRIHVVLPFIRGIEKISSRENESSGSSNCL